MSNSNYIILLGGIPLGFLPQQRVLVQQQQPQQRVFIQQPQQRVFIQQPRQQVFVPQQQVFVPRQQVVGYASPAMLLPQKKIIGRVTACKRCHNLFGKLRYNHISSVCTYTN